MPSPQLFRLRVSVASALLVVTSPLLADVSLPSFFGSGMVLQRDMPVAIWGKADPGETVTVTLTPDDTAATRANAEGRWSVRLPARAASAEPLSLTVTGANTLRLDDILVGDVWLCSGQSNMALRVSTADNADAEIAAADFPRIRLFTVARAVADSPRDDVKGRWEACAPGTIRSFSAVGYFFGRQLHQNLNVPIGLIHSSWGGTAAEAWTPREVLAADENLKPILERWDATMADFPRIKAEFEANKERLTAEWKLAVVAAKEAGRTPPSQPRLRTGPNTQYQPAGLYHAMIAPLAPLSLRGVIWYQGEANAGRAEQYRTLFPALIEAWRAAWDRPDLPFLFVQLPNLDRQPEPSRSGWAELREAQALTLATPHTAMAVTIDVGDPKDLHPTNKLDVGRRLALAAEAQVYGLPRAGRLSPIFQRATFDGREARLEFDTPDGLAARDGKPLEGFVIAGADRAFVPAQARIEGDRVIVWSESVPDPVAVRYAWADNPACNLTSGADLPASPFRTDDWPAVTTGRR